MQIVLQFAALLLIIVASISLVKQPLTSKRRFRTAAQFLLAALLFWTAEALRIRTGGEARFGQPKLDRSSITASFNSISAEGAQRQLVFHYTLENNTSQPFQIGQSACSMVSFRFTKIANNHSAPRTQPNPALNILEKDQRAYPQVTGLQRLPTANPALSLDQCPLELQPKERRGVAIAIPYAYSGTADENPNESDLKMYVRAFMPQMNGFGMWDPARKYVIEFPRAW